MLYRRLILTAAVVLVLSLVGAGEAAASTGPQRTTIAGQLTFKHFPYEAPPGAGQNVPLRDVRVTIAKADGSATVATTVADQSGNFSATLGGVNSGDQIRLWVQLDHKDGRFSIRKTSGEVQVMALGPYSINYGGSKSLGTISTDRSDRRAMLEQYNTVLELWNNVLSGSVRMTMDFNEIRLQNSSSSEPLHTSSPPGASYVTLLIPQITYDISKDPWRLDNDRRRLMTQVARLAMLYAGPYVPWPINSTHTAPALNSSQPNSVLFQEAFARFLAVAAEHSRGSRPSYVTLDWLEQYDIESTQCSDRPRGYHYLSFFWDLYDSGDPSSSDSYSKSAGYLLDKLSAFEPTSSQWATAYSALLTGTGTILRDNCLTGL